MADAEKLTTWLAEEVCSRERRAERVREALLAKLREERIEQPSRIRLGRMIASALRQSKETAALQASPGSPRRSAHVNAAVAICR